MARSRSRILLLLLCVLQIVLCLIGMLVIGISAAMARLRPPGVDQIGGISLVYEMKVPPGAKPSANLAADMAEALQRRVDPDGVLNLVFRPREGHRLEILVPLSPTAKAWVADWQALRERIAAAASGLKAMNISRDIFDEIFAATESHGDDRQDVVIHNNAEQDRDLTVLRKRLGITPDANDAIDGYIKAKRALSDFNQRDRLEFQRLLKGAGVLGFHILVSDNPNSKAAMPPGEYQAYVRRLHANGPSVQPADTAQWFQVGAGQEIGSETETWHYNRYVLGYIKPASDGTPRSLDSNAAKAWRLTDARPELESNGERIVSFQFDPQGATYFGDLTGANLGNSLAIVLDNKALSAPTINSKIGGSGIITGGGNGFTPGEIAYLTSTLKNGSLPATLSDEPLEAHIVGPQSLGRPSMLRYWRLPAFIAVTAWMLFCISALVRISRKSRADAMQA